MNKLKLDKQVVKGVKKEMVYNVLCLYFSLFRTGTIQENF